MSEMTRLYQCDETESLARFVMLMGRELARNQHKGGWRGDTPRALLRRLREEVVELERAIETGDPVKISEEAADVANFAMMIQDNFWDGE